MSENGANTSVLLTEMWEFESQKGNKYFSGFLGAARVVLLFGGEKEHPKRPGETVRVWRLLAEPKAPQERRAPQRQAPPPPPPRPEPKPAPKASTPWDDLGDLEADLSMGEEGR